jgi:uncharacterized protein YjbJ (UPF0337 family)
MNRESIEGNWTPYKGDVNGRWRRLTEDQLDVIAGRRDDLARQIQAVYGSLKHAQWQLPGWQNRQNAWEYSNG